MNSNKIGYLILTTLAILALIGLFLSTPVEQNTAYHNFCDGETFFGIPNFWNVISNLPFLIVGLLGLNKMNKIAEAKPQYLIFFLGISLVSLGSGYYHLSPDNHTLVWDRLPMAIAFMALFSIVISEFICFGTGQRVLIPLLILGLLSVIYWWYFDDLRFYLVVQFYPMLAIPVILIFFKSKYNLTVGYWLLLLAYVVAKVFEQYDNQAHHLFGFSGHPLKHIFASIGLFILLYTYVKRRRST